MARVHKKFTDDQVKKLMERYLNKTIERTYVQDILGIEKAMFFRLLQRYRHNPQEFSIQYHRQSNPKIPQNLENNIIKELKVDKQLIQDPTVPLKSYNYSYIKNRLKANYNQKVSLTTIIRRAKIHGFYLGKRKKTTHDREVLTNYVGELIQHDSSHHLFAPAAGKMWYLITSLDDYSRRILYGDLFESESSWRHIRASCALIITFGCPFSYYVDSHSIFRFVQSRDSLWRKHHLVTDQADTQWKQVMNDCRINVIHALSPQARGKIERPCAWLQDHLVRTCARENISDIKQARKVLYQEINQYNYHQVHSTTGEIPFLRFQRALKEDKSLFRHFTIPAPFIDNKDIFCLRLKRTIDSYRKISINNTQLKLNNATPRETADLRISPINKTIAEVRCWCNNKLIDVLRVKITDLGMSTFEV